MKQERVRVRHRIKGVNLDKLALPVQAVVGTGLLFVPDARCKVVGAVMVVDAARRVGLFDEKKN